MTEPVLEQIKELSAKLDKEAFCIEVEVLDGGKLPTKAHASDAGFDVYAAEDVAIYPGQIYKVPLNIRMKLPMNTWAEITTKSGLGSKGQLVYAGVIDEAYRGIPHVICTNLRIIAGFDEDGIPLMNVDPIVIKKGEKIAQMIMNPYSNRFRIVKVDAVDTATDRGEGGFGSSGK